MVLNFFPWIPIASGEKNREIEIRKKKAVDLAGVNPFNRYMEELPQPSFTVQESQPVITQDLEEEDLGFPGFQIRLSEAIAVDPRGHRWAHSKQPPLEQAPPRGAAPNHPEHYIAPSPVRTHVYRESGEKCIIQ